MNAFGVFIINTFVTGGTRGRDVIEMYGGAFIIFPKGKMSAVAIRTDRTGQEPFFYQTLPMDTIGVVHECIPSACPYRRRMAQLAVAIPAELRDIGTIGLISFVQV